MPDFSQSWGSQALAHGRLPQKQNKCHRFLAQAWRRFLPDRPLILSNGNAAKISIGLHHNLQIVPLQIP